MKTLKFIGFVPAFFITGLIINLIFTLIVKITGFDNILDAFWYMMIMKPFIISYLGTTTAIEVYPNVNKKPAIIIIGIALSISLLTIVYITNELSEYGFYISGKQIWTMIVSFIGYFCASYYMKD